MSTFIPLRGRALCIVPDDETQSKGGILFPDARRRRRTLMRCVLHNPRGPEDFTSKLIAVEKWVWTDLKLGTRNFYLIPEEAVFAIIDEEGDDSMTTGELIDDVMEELKAQIVEIVGSADLTTELSAAQRDRIATEVALDIAGNIEGLEESESENERSEDVTE